MLKQKRRVAADLAGWNLTAGLIDPDDCWRAVCLLRSYDASGGIATCEMGLARAGLIQWLFDQYPDPGLRGKLVAASVRLASGYFNGEDGIEVLEFYGEPMPIVAPKIIALYREDAFPLAQLSDRLASRIGVPGTPSIEIAPLFQEVADRFAEAMRSVEII